jgi:hypothetical protein
MIFGAMAAWQAWLLLAGAAGLAAGVFLMKLRPPRMLVPSLLLWRRVLDEARELTLWERIRRAVSLVLTVLIALALALAVTRPGRAAGGTVTAGRLLIVLDSSWSMQARTSGGETRWERAVAEARRLIAGASGGEVALATTATGLVEGPTTDGALIETALERLRPGGGDAGAWPRLADAGAVHFLTDGATPRPIEPDVIVHSVFEAAPNVAITALDVRPSIAPGHAGDAYLEIANFSRAPQKVRLTLVRGASTIFDRSLDMRAGEALRQAVPLPRGGDPALRARVEADDNALDADDEAAAWIERARPIEITVVGADTAWLRNAFERNPDVRATFVQPGEYRAGGEQAVVFAGWAPIDPPQRPALLFAPRGETTWLNPAPPPTAERAPRWQVVGDHPVVQGVDPLTLSIERARMYQGAGLTPIALSARGTPLVYAAESAETRTVLVTFGPDESNLASAPGFPVLLGNAIEWLTHPVPNATRHPGLMTFGHAVEKVTGPDGTSVPLARVDVMAVGMLRDSGLYRVEGAGGESTIAVNVGDPLLSNLMRTPPLATAKASPVQSGASGRPWWLYLAAAAFMLALAEWWTWQRRITV